MGEYEQIKQLYLEMKIFVDPRYFEWNIEVICKYILYIMSYGRTGNI